MQQHQPILKKYLKDRLSNWEIILPLFERFLIENNSLSDYIELINNPVLNFRTDGGWIHVTQLISHPYLLLTGDYDKWNTLDDKWNNYLTELKNAIF